MFQAFTKSMSLRVLLADESSSIKKVFQLGLQDYGAEVKSVHSGLDVIEVALAFRPDIIFADILLQKVNGYEVAKNCKSDKRLNHLPVILMWSSFMELDGGKFKDCGARGEIEKPFDVENMRELIRDWVPRLKEQNMASFLKFPPSITHDFVDEEKAKGSEETATVPTPQPKASHPFNETHLAETNEPESPGSPPPTPSYTEAQAPGGDFVIEPASEAPLIESELESPTIHSSVFNSPDFEIESEALEVRAPDQGEGPAIDNSVDVSQWAVNSEGDSAGFPNPVATEALTKTSSSFNGKNPKSKEDPSLDEDSWTVTQLQSPFKEGASEDEDSFPDEFSSFNLRSPGPSLFENKPEPPPTQDLPQVPLTPPEPTTDKALDPDAPIEPDDFLYRPEKNQPAKQEAPPALSIQTAEPPQNSRSATAGDTDLSMDSPESLKQIEVIVEQKVLKYIESEKIDHLVRAHVQDLIQKRVGENMNRIIEKIAKEELEKLLAEELNANLNDTKTTS